jgi:3-deoxy-D-manno-octulosonic-acid transferase
VLFNLLYLTLIFFGLPWLAVRSYRTRRYREGWSEKLLGRVPFRSGDRPCIWLHAVSVGEVNALKPLVLAIQREHPEIDLAVSTTTQTGMQLAQTLYQSAIVFYCPLDFTWGVRRAIKRIRPSILLLTELELWPNLIASAKAANCKTAVINGRLSANSLKGYQRIRPLIRNAVDQLDRICVQDETYRDRFRQLGARRESISITGSLKFDGAISDRNAPGVRHMRTLLGIRSSDIVWVVGSTQSPEEAAAVTAFVELADEFPNLRLIVVPRHPERFAQVAEVISEHKVRFLQRSDLDTHPETSPRHREDWQVCLCDSIGELSNVWGLASLSFVGGSFGKREGQNMIEPAAFGCCVSVGPKTKNFRDIVRLLLDAQAITVLDEPEQMRDWVRMMLTNDRLRRETGQSAFEIARQHRGATARTLAAILPLLNRVSIGHESDQSVSKAA